AQSRTTFDEGGVQRSTSEQRMRGSWEIFRIDAIELGEKESGVPNGVDAKVPSAAVGSAPVHRYFDPSKTAMCGHDREARRLRDDRGVGPNFRRDQPARPETLPFFVDNRGDDDVSPHLTAKLRRRGAHRGNTALH